jgi:glycosyltransferase involved in cell wall biosynthesis
MRAPHVLVLGTVLDQPFGGVRRHNSQLLPRVSRLLKERGGSLSILTGSGGLGFDVPDEVEVIASSISSGPPWKRTLFEGRVLRRTIAESRESERPFDLLHTAHHPTPRGLPIPMALLMHDLRALVSPLRRLVARKIIGRGLRDAARIITVSGTTATEIAESFPIDRSDIAIVPNGADHFDPLPRTANRDAPLLCLGHVEERKNIGLLLEALAAAPELPDLLVAGAAKGDEEQRLRTLAFRLGVERRVRFLGIFEEERLPHLLAEAACIVLPSRLEGFGIGVLEAMRARAPLAISRIPAHLEVANESIPTFAIDDAEGCARAIREALDSDRDSREAAFDWTSRYRWQDAAEILLETWRQAAGPLTPPSASPAHSPPPRVP